LERYFAHRIRAQIDWRSQPIALGVAGISSTNSRGSNTAELKDEWKLFFSGVKPTHSSEAVGILVSPQLTGYVDEWIPLREIVCILRLKLIDCSIGLLQVYDANTNALYPEFVEETSDSLRRVKLDEPMIILESSVHTLEMRMSYGRVQLVNMVMLT